MTCLCPTLQAGGEGLDSGATARHLPPILRQGCHAHLCRQYGGAVQMEQEGVGHGAGQLLLGLLLHPSVWRLRERPVRNDRSSSGSVTRHQDNQNPHNPLLSTHMFAVGFEIVDCMQSGLLAFVLLLHLQNPHLCLKS